MRNETTPPVAEAVGPARRASVFVLIVAAIVGGGYAYLGTELISPFELDGWACVAAWLAFALPFAMIVWLPAVYWQKDEPSATDDRLLWVAFGGMSFLSYVLLFTVVRDLLLLLARAFGLIAGLWQGPGVLGGVAGAATGWASGPSYVPLWLIDARGSAMVLGLSVIGWTIAFFAARGAQRIERVEVPIAGLAPALDGLTIAQISDLHIGPVIRGEFVDRVVASVNALKPDLIAMTGDIVDGSVHQFKGELERLRALRAPLGRYYVTGNHEFYWETDQWIRELRGAGLTVLLNEHAVVERGGARFVIAGVLDHWATRNGHSTASDPRAALEGAPADASLRVLLAHQPKTALLASQLGYDLQLSGHTHGGQFFPWTLVIKFLQPFVRGLSKAGRMWIYVNRGTGYWGPPARLGSPSEITLLTMRRPKP